MSWRYHEAFRFAVDDLVKYMPTGSSESVVPTHPVDELYRSPRQRNIVSACTSPSGPESLRWSLETPEKVVARGIVICT